MELERLFEEVLKEAGRLEGQVKKMKDKIFEIEDLHWDRSHSGLKVTLRKSDRGYEVVKENFELRDEFYGSTPEEAMLEALIETIEINDYEDVDSETKDLLKKYGYRIEPNPGRSSEWRNTLVIKD